METRANYVAIGAFVMVVFLSLLGSLYWLYKSSEPGATAQVRIIFTEPVTGLSTGGSVLFNGIRVGEVTQLFFAPGGGDDVIATVRISQNAPIKTDTVAKLGFQGLTGVAYISLTGGQEKSPSLFATGDEDTVPTIRAETSAFTNVLDSVQSVLERVNTTLNDVNGFLSTNRGKLDEVVTNVSELTSTLNTAAPKVSGLIDDIAAAGKAVATAAPQITSVVDRANSILGAIEPSAVTTIVNNVQDFSGALPDVATDARQIVGVVNGLVSRLDDTAKTLGEAVAAVRDVAASVDTDAVGSIVANVRAATGVFATKATEIGTLIDNTTAISTDLRDVSQTIAARRQDIGDALDGLGALMTEARKAVASTAPAIEQFSAAISAITPQRVESIVTNADTIVSDLANQMPALNSFITSSTQAATSIATLSESLVKRSETIDAALVDGGALIKSLREAAATAPDIVASVGRSVDHVGEVVDAIDPKAVGEMVASANRFAGALAEQDAHIASLVTGADSAIRRIDAIASSLAQRMPQIGTIIDGAEKTTQDVQTFAATLPKLMGTLEPGVANVSEVLQAIDPKAVEGMVADASALMDTLAAQREAISGLVTDASGAARSIDTLAGSLADSAPKIRSIIDQADGAMTPVRQFADGLPQLLTSLQPGVENVGTVLEALSADEIAKIQTDIATFASVLSEQGGAIGTLIQSTSGAAVRIEAIASAFAQRMPQIGEIIDGAEGSVASVRRFADALPGFADTLQPGIANISDVLAAIDPDAVREAVEGVAAVAKAAGAEAPRIAGIVTSVEKASEGAADIATRLSSEMGKVTTILDDTQVALTNAREFAAALPAMLAEARPGIVNASEALGAIDPNAVAEIVENARSLTASLRGAEGEITSILASASKAAQDIQKVSAAVAERTDAVQRIIDDAASFAGNLSAAGPRIEGLINSADGALDAVRNTVSAVNAQAINDIVDNVKTVAATIGSRSGEIGAAIDNATQAAKGLADGLGTLGGSDGTLKEILDQAKRIGANLEGASQQVNVVVQRINALLDGPVQGMIGNISVAARDVGEVAAAFASRAGQIATGLGRFSQGGLDDLRALMNQGRSTLSSIETAVSSFDRDPSRVIFGGPDGPRYTPQRR